MNNSVSEKCDNLDLKNKLFAKKQTYKIDTKDLNMNNLKYIRKNKIQILTLFPS